MRFTMWCKILMDENFDKWLAVCQKLSLPTLFSIVFPMKPINLHVKTNNQCIKQNFTPIKVLCCTVVICHFIFIHRLGELHLSIEAYDQAILLDSFFIEAYIGRGNVHMDYLTSSRIIMSKSAPTHTI